MPQMIEVSAVVAGSCVPLGLLTVRQALDLPHLTAFRFCQATADAGQERCLSRRELEELVRQ
ncbi:hypothetical protein OCK02_03485 (plasmid) [Rhizobium sp. TRM96647]|uniref:hypothetical protein n=1 Tax=unclassified Rhizobium TaxID=2613769 RepID=UPI0021E9543B|nr:MULTISPECIES: hypothetical protein [unclassified Rhizobium]MCV3735255.1 hypothetical protein [Rhizobium sp. TRM96647]MCV3757982.1 hypothetical protein [Rhizobium sp. TRM96650]